MNTRTILIVGMVGVLCSCKLPAEVTDAVKLSDDYFEYAIGDKGTHALKCVNKDATLGDLYRFVNAECWNNHLKRKFLGRKLTRDNADVLDLCIDVHLEMLDTIGEVMLRDLLGTNYFQKCVEIVPHTNQMNKVLALRELKRLRSEFIGRRENVGEPIRRWASVYSECPTEVAWVLHTVFSASGDFNRRVVWTDNNQYTGWKLKGTGSFIEAMVLLQCLEALVDRDPHWFEDVVKSTIKKDGMEIGDSWRSLHRQVQIYVDEIREISNSIARMRNSGVADSLTKKVLSDAMSKWEHRCEYATRKFDYLLYDLPCCMMSYRALGRLRACKYVFSDDEVQMKSVAADYSYAICGTDVLKGIRTRYAASCYTEVIKFLKSELGWFTQDAFKEFANETKLYNITLKTDENNKQDNLLEKWE